MSTTKRWVQVAVARPFAEALTYAVPQLLGVELQIGHVVSVPLGSAIETGYVVGFPAEPGFDVAKIKPVRGLVDPMHFEIVDPD